MQNQVCSDSNGWQAYKVQVGDNIYVEKPEVASGEDVSFNAMLSPTTTA